MGEQTTGERAQQEGVGILLKTIPSFSLPNIMCDPTDFILR